MSDARRDAIPARERHLEMISRRKATNQIRKQGQRLFLSRERLQGGGEERGTSLGDTYLVMQQGTSDTRCGEEEYVWSGAHDQRR